MEEGYRVTCENCGVKAMKSRPSRFCGDRCRSAFWSGVLKDAEKHRREAAELSEQQVQCQWELREIIERLLGIVSGRTRDKPS